MKITGINVLNARAPSDKQKNVGIWGNFDLAIMAEVTPGQPFTLVSLKKLSLRKTKDGKMFIGTPSEKQEQADGTNKYWPYYYLYPDKDMPGRDEYQGKLVEKIKQAMEASAKKPAATPKAAAPTAQDDDDY